MAKLHGLRTLEETVEYVRSKGIDALLGPDQGRIEVSVRLGLRELLSIVTVLRALDDLTIDQFGAFVDRHISCDEAADMPGAFLRLATATVRCEAVLTGVVKDNHG